MAVPTVWNSLPTELRSTSVSRQWRTQDFRMGGVEVPQAPKRVGSGEGYLPPHLRKGLGMGMYPLPIKFFVFFVENTIF